MNNQTPPQFLSTLHNLANSDITHSPEFIFMVALSEQLISDMFEPTTARHLAAQFQIPLPADAGTEQLQEMGYYCADLITRCYGYLQKEGSFNNPNDEAVLLAQRLINKALA